MVLTSLFSRLVIVIVGVLYPAYCSFKAVKYKDHREYTTWMMYWIVFAIFLTVETFSDVFLSWLPFYYEIKIVIVIWLALPYTQGAKTLYRRLIHHKLVDSESQIDELMSNAGQVSFGLVRKASSVVVNHASEGIMTAAMRISKQEERINNNNLKQVIESSVTEKCIRVTSNSPGILVQYSTFPIVNSSSSQTASMCNESLGSTNAATGIAQLSQTGSDYIRKQTTIMGKIILKRYHHAILK